MRAHLVREFGQPGAVGEKDKPVPAEGELLVRVRAAGVNAMDAGVRAGFLKDRMEHRFPLTLGMDYAGTVESLGPGVSGFEVGEDVFGANGKLVLGEGTFAEYATVSAAFAARRPAGLTPEQAAALPTAGTTALAAVEALAANAGETVAVIGAAGGVGGFAVQLAALRGLRVIAATRAEHEAFVRGLGAATVVDYAKGDLTSLLQAAAPGGLDGLIDVFHDGPTLLKLVPAVKPGRVIATPAAFGAAELFAGQPVRLVPVRAARERVGELGELVAAGKLAVELEVLPLEQATEAVHRQSTRGNRGKLVLRID